MAFSFGQPAQQQQATPSSSFSFGSANNAPTANKPLFGGFSTPNLQQSAPASGSLFGQNTTASANPAPSTSLFGTPQTQPAQNTRGGLFGSQQPAAGASAPTGGLFGSTSQPAQGGGLFGSTAQNPGTSGTGLFGQTQTQAQPAQTGGLFGQPAAAPATGALGGSLFGNTSTATPAPSGGLFGQSAQKPGGLFGSTTQPSQPSTGLFGSTQPAQTGGIFGQSAAQPSQPTCRIWNTGPSTSQQPQTQQPSLFGSNQPALGSSTNNALNASTSLGLRQEPDIESRIMAVQRAWDTNNPECRFTYYFYNVVEPGTTSRYGRPANATDEAKWAKAVRENPDPDSMVPVLATGWTDVKRRIQMQEQIASVQAERVKEITNALSQLSRQASLSSSIRLTALQAQLQNLLHRLVHLAAQTPQFIPVLQSSSLRPEEIEIQKTLESVKTDLDGRTRKISGPSGTVGVGIPRRQITQGQGRLIGHINEMWGQVEEVRRQRRGRVNGEKESWLTDERALGEVAQVLSQQQTALSKLNEVLNAALFDADVMRQGLGMVASESRS